MEKGTGGVTTPSSLGDCPLARPHRRSWFSAPQAPACPSIPCAAKLGAPGSLAAMPPPLLLFFLLFLTPEGVRPQETLQVEAKGMSKGYRWKELGVETWLPLGALGQGTHPLWAFILLFAKFREELGL